MRKLSLHSNDLAFWMTNCTFQTINMYKNCERLYLVWSTVKVQLRDLSTLLEALYVSIELELFIRIKPVICFLSKNVKSEPFYSSVMVNFRNILACAAAFKNVSLTRSLTDKSFVNKAQILLWLALTNLNCFNICRKTCDETSYKLSRGLLHLLFRNIQNTVPVP